MTLAQIFHAKLGEKKSKMLCVCPLYASKSNNTYIDVELFRYESWSEFRLTCQSVF